MNDIKKEKTYGISGITRRSGISKISDEKYYYSFIAGFVIYFAIIVVAIPIFLYKKKFYTLFLAYIPNIDLIANVLTWWQGPWDIFKHLYLQNPVTMPSLFTQIFINYMSLLGITFIIIGKSVKHKDFFIGWGMGAVMLFLTYLTPARVVNYFMTKINAHINDDNMVAILGLLITALIIFVEYHILENYESTLAKLAKGFINMPDLILLP
jgi:hypothetical protein